MCHHFHRFAVEIDAPSRQSNAGRGLEGDADHDVLAGGNAAQHAAGMVAQEAARGDLVAVFGAFLFDARKACADFHAFDRVDAHHRLGDVGIEAIEDWFAPPGRHAGSHHVNARTDGIAFLAQGVHVGLQLPHPFGLRAEERILCHGIPILQRQLMRSELGKVAAHHDAVALAQVFLGYARRRHPHAGFARGGAAATTIVAKAVLLRVGVVGVTGAEAVEDIVVVLGALVGVLDQKADRRTGGTAFENAGQDPDPVFFTALRRMPRLAGLAAIQVALQVRFRKRQSGRTTVDNAGIRRAVAFAAGGDSEQCSKGVTGHGALL